MASNDKCILYIAAVLIAQLRSLLIEAHTNKISLLHGLKYCILFTHYTYICIFLGHVDIITNGWNNCRVEYEVQAGGVSKCGN